MKARDSDRSGARLVGNVVSPAAAGHPGWPLVFEYESSKHIALQDHPFYALVMAAMRQADEENLRRLRLGFEDVWQELQARYHAPGGVLPGEPS